MLNENPFKQRSTLLATLLFMAYALFLTLAALPGFPADMQDGRALPYLADKPVGEDGYYMLTVAWNMAEGRGITYNGGQPTSGVQPLATFVYAGLAWMVKTLGGDRWDFARAVLFYGALTQVLFAWLMGRAFFHLPKQEKNHSGAALVFWLALFNFGFLRAFTYGLETGLYLCLLAGALHLSLSWQKKPPDLKNTLQFGVLAGLLGLARLDFGIILAVLLGMMLLRGQLRWWQSLLAGAIALLVTSPWFLYVKTVTGSFWPSSGGAQAEMIAGSNALLRLRVMGEALLGHFSPWFFLNGGYMALPALLTLGGLAVLVLQQKSARQSLRGALAEKSVLLSWLLALLPLPFIYCAFFWATHFYDRYSMPLVIVSLPLLGLAGAALLEKLPAQATRLAPLLLGLAFFGWAGLSLHSGRIGNTHTVAAGYIQHYFSHEKVGVFQSGVIGYFNPNVINLDGKVNQEALEASEAGKLGDYLDEEGISVLVDWPKYIQRALPQAYLDAGWQACPQAIPGGADLCYIRK